MNDPVPPERDRPPVWCIRFSLQRWLGILIKEFIQLKRDRLTFSMIVMIPIMQLLLFGFAINADPKHLPTAVVMADPGPYARSFLSAMSHSDYFHIVGVVDEKTAETALKWGDVQFVVTFPVGFHRDLARGKSPVLFVEADATDPMAMSNAQAALSYLVANLKAPEMPQYRTQADVVAGPGDPGPCCGTLDF